MSVLIEPAHRRVKSPSAVRLTAHVCAQAPPDGESSYVNRHYEFLRHSLGGYVCVLVVLVKRLQDVGGLHLAQEFCGRPVSKRLDVGDGQDDVGMRLSSKEDCLWNAVRMVVAYV